MNSGSENGALGLSGRTDAIHDQALGRRERQRPDEHGVHHREHRRRRADRERERADDRQREARLADMLAERDAEIVQHGSHRILSEEDTTICDTDASKSVSLRLAQLACRLGYG